MVFFALMFWLILFPICNHWSIALKKNSTKDVNNKNMWVDKGVGLMSKD